MRVASRTGVCWIVALGLFCGAAQAADEPVAWGKWKKVWSDLTPEEQTAYQQAASEFALARASAFGQPIQPMAPGATCQESTHEVGGLPYGNSNDTAMQTENYSWANQCGCSPIDPEINDSCNQPGTGPAKPPCCGGFNQLSGDGPDIAYRIVTDVDCTLQVAMTPVSMSVMDCAVAPLPPDCVDLALYVTTDCNAIQNGCVGADDYGSFGETETVPFQATAGTPYFVVVDGFAGLSGGFDLSITEIGAVGCQLVTPVELQGFSVD